MGCSSSVLAEAGNASISGRYELGAVIGEGSYAQVRAAVHQRSGETSAVKVLNLQAHVPSAAGLLVSARDHAALWRQIGQHQHCVHLRDFFESSAQVCFVMERCESSLQQSFASVRCAGPAEVARTIREMLFGLEHLHSLRIVHRDVKPSHFLTGGPSGLTLKLSGFDSAASLPRSGVLFGACGTPLFISPEMAADRAYATGTDIWSLGVVVYELLCGRLPHAASSSESAKMTTVRLGGSPLNFETAANITPVSAEAKCLVRRLLEHAPQRRLSACEALQHPLLHTASLPLMSSVAKGDSRGDCAFDPDVASTCSGISLHSLSLVFSDDDTVGGRLSGMSAVGLVPSGSSECSVSSVGISVGKVSGLSPR